MMKPENVNMKEPTCNMSSDNVKTVGCVLDSEKQLSALAQDISSMNISSSKKSISYGKVIKHLWKAVRQWQQRKDVSLLGAESDEDDYVAAVSGGGSRYRTSVLGFSKKCMYPHERKTPYPRDIPNQHSLDQFQHDGEPSSEVASTSSEESDNSFGLSDETYETLTLLTVEEWETLILEVPEIMQFLEEDYISPFILSEVPSISVPLVNDTEDTLSEPGRNLAVASPPVGSVQTYENDSLIKNGILQLRELIKTDTDEFLVQYVYITQRIKQMEKKSMMNKNGVPSVTDTVLLKFLLEMASVYDVGIYKDDERMKTLWKFKFVALFRYIFKKLTNDQIEEIFCKGHKLHEFESLIPLQLAAFYINQEPAITLCIAHCMTDLERNPDQKLDWLVGTKSSLLYQLKLLGGNYQKLYEELENVRKSGMPVFTVHCDRRSEALFIPDSNEHQQSLQDLLQYSLLSFENEHLF